MSFYDLHCKKNVRCLKGKINIVKYINNGTPPRKYVIVEFLNMFYLVINN